MLLRVLVLVHLLAGMTAAHAGVPVVYADDHIEIGAAVAEAGAVPMHLGEPLTLVVEASFDPEVVQVESLGADWFRRTFAELRAVSLLAAHAPVTLEGGKRRVRIVSRFQFQLIGCPPDLAHCPGAKRFELPLANIAYRLSSGAAASERSARFTPWPGRIDVVPAIPFEPADSIALEHVIPGGAWPAPRTMERRAGAGAAMGLAGALLLVTAVVAGRRRGSGPSSPGRHAASVSRWERAALELADPALADDTWADLLRRCITWYCQDELGRNPVEWVRAADAGGDAMMADCRALYLDVLAEERIEKERRESFLGRWARVTGRGPTGDNVSVSS